MEAVVGSKQKKGRGSNETSLCFFISRKSMVVLFARGLCLLPSAYCLLSAACCPGFGEL
jgi:hypothetical protein